MKRLSKYTGDSKMRTVHMMRILKYYIN
jgi:hypothetical protein